MTVHIIESRLAELLDRGILARGGHSAYSGHRCANEWVAYIAGEPHTAAPACVSPVLRRYTMTLNDRWDDAQRQTLAPYLPRMLGTGGDGLDAAREEIARQALVTDLLPAWLRLAGLDEEADILAATGEGDIYAALSRASDAAWEARQAALQRVRDAVLAKLAGRPVAEAGVAAAAAAAAVAAAGVAAGVAAVAAAVAGVEAVAGDYWTSCDAAFAAARPIFEEAIAESTAPKMVAIRELAAAQRGAALDLLDRMIRPEVA